MVKAVSVTPTQDIPQPSPDRKMEAKQKLDKFIEEERRLVKGRFRCYETPGWTGPIQQLKYKALGMFTKHMTDGEVYEIPLWVARWLNGTDVTAEAVGGKINSCSYFEHGFTMNGPTDLKPSQLDGQGIPVPLITGKYKRRYGFESLEFSA